MPHPNILPCILFGLLLFPGSKLSAQCPPSVSAAACTGTESLVSADETINSGTTRWYYGAPVIMNSLTMRGGRLIVCGDLTIDKFYMDSGQIIINPGGRFVIGGGIGAGLILMGNSSIYNFGTFEVQRNLSLENGWATAAAPNVIINATQTSLFKMLNQYFVINNANSWLVNNGLMQCWGLITDVQSSASSVCLGPESKTSMNILINKVKNTYTVPTGGACVYVVQQSQFFNQLTASRGLFACLAATHHSDTGCIPFGCTPNAWGSAQVFNNCNTCASLGVLPVQFGQVAVTSGYNMNMLGWEMELNGGMYMFYIERSEDGQHFSGIDSVRPAYTKYFHYNDESAPAGTTYYRIRCMDMLSGLSITSKIVSSTMIKQGGSRMFPSPFSGSFSVSLPSSERVLKIIVHDMSGNNIRVKWQQQLHTWKVNVLSPVGEQLLLVQVVTNNRVWTERIMSE